MPSGARLLTPSSGSVRSSVTRAPRSNTGRTASRPSAKRTRRRSGNTRRQGNDDPHRYWPCPHGRRRRLGGGIPGDPGHDLLLWSRRLRLHGDPARRRRHRYRPGADRAGMTDIITSKDKLKCVERELVRRKRYYPNLVELGFMNAVHCEREIAIMEAIAEDYEWAVAGEPLS